MFILETNHIKYSNLNVKSTNICVLEQEQVLDEAYLDALEQKVWTDKLHIFMWSRQV